MVSGRFSAVTHFHTDCVLQILDLDLLLVSARKKSSLVCWQWQLVESVTGTRTSVKSHEQDVCMFMPSYISSNQTRRSLCIYEVIINKQRTKASVHAKYGMIWYNLYSQTKEYLCTIQSHQWFLIALAPVIELFFVQVPIAEHFLFLFYGIA